MGHECTRAANRQGAESDPGDNQQRRQGDDPPEEVAQQQTECSTDDGDDEVEKQRFSRTHGEIRLIDLGFHHRHQTTSGGDVGHRFDGTAEDGGFYEFRIAEDFRLYL